MTPAWRNARAPRTPAGASAARLLLRHRAQLKPAVIIEQPGFGKLEPAGTAQQGIGRTRVRRAAAHALNRALLGFGIAGAALDRDTGRLGGRCGGQCKGSRPSMIVSYAASAKLRGKPASPRRTRLIKIARMNPSALLHRSYLAAVAAADPLKIVPPHLRPHLPLPGSGKTLVIGAGKAAASMAKAVEHHWPQAASLDGIVITRYAHGYSGSEALKRIRVIEAGHPVPDASGEAAARDIMARVQALGPDDLLLALVSGGGSSLLALPVASISMDDLKATTRELLRCGAPIQDMNVVRKHLSLIQGGNLAAMCQARIVSLVISDVTGDEPTHIASGPTVPDPSTYQDAQGILAKFDCRVPASVRAHLDAGARGDIAETPKPGSPVFARAQTHVIATAHHSLEAPAPWHAVCCVCMCVCVCVSFPCPPAPFRPVRCVHVRSCDDDEHTRTLEMSSGN